MSRKLRPALNIVSDIGSLGFDLQHHSEPEIRAAVDLIRKVNPEMLDWIARMLASQATIDPDQTELNRSIAAAFELGHNCCERGMNIQRARQELQRVLSTPRANGPQE